MDCHPTSRRRHRREYEKYEYVTERLRLTKNQNVLFASLKFNHFIYYLPPADLYILAEFVQHIDFDTLNNERHKEYMYPLTT